MLNLTQLLSCRNAGYLRYKRRNSPVIVWNITRACNLDCSFCYYDADKNPSGKDYLDFKLAKHIIEQLRQAQIKFVLLSGGEPLLYPEIFNLLKKLTSFSIQVGISTNGTLINKTLAQDLKRSGARYVGISLDGAKGTHNTLRNSPTAFDQALIGLRYAQDSGLKTGIRLTLNTNNYTRIREFFSFVEGLNVDRLCFYHLVYSGRAKTSNDLTRAKRKKTIELLIDLTMGWVKRKIATEVLSVDNFSDGAILLDYLRRKRFKNYSSVLGLLKKQGGCPAGRGILSIDHLGVLHPCQFWTVHNLADLKKDNLLDFLNNGNPFKQWRVKLKGRCSLCDFKEICAGCRLRAFQAYADYWQEDPACCLEAVPPTSPTA